MVSIKGYSETIQSQLRLFQDSGHLEFKPSKIKILIAFWILILTGTPLLLISTMNLLKYLTISFLLVAILLIFNLIIISLIVAALLSYFGSKGTLTANENGIITHGYFSKKLRFWREILYFSTMKLRSTTKLTLTTIDNKTWMLGSFFYDDISFEDLAILLNTIKEHYQT